MTLAREYLKYLMLAMFSHSNHITKFMESLWLLKTMEKMAWLQTLTTSLFFEITKVSNSVHENQDDKTYETVGLFSFQYNHNYA